MSGRLAAVSDFFFFLLSEMSEWGLKRNQTHSKFSEKKGLKGNRWLCVKYLSFSFRFCFKNYNCIEIFYTPTLALQAYTIITTNKLHLLLWKLNYLSPKISNASLKSKFLQAKTERMNDRTVYDTSVLLFLSSMRPFGHAETLNNRSWWGT